MNLIARETVETGFFFVYFSLAKLRVAQSDLPRVAISRAITHRRTHTLIFASQCSCVCVKCVLDVLACVECLNVWLCGLGNIAPLVLLLLLLFVNQPSKKSENSLQPHFYRVFIFRIETSTTPKSVKHQFQHQNTIRLCPPYWNAQRSATPHLPSASFLRFCVIHFNQYLTADIPPVRCGESRSPPWWCCVWRKFIKGNLQTYFYL